MRIRYPDGFEGGLVTLHVDNVHCHGDEPPQFVGWLGDDRQKRIDAGGQFEVSEAGRRHPVETARLGDLSVGNQPLVHRKRSGFRPEGTEEIVTGDRVRPRRGRRCVQLANFPRDLERGGFATPYNQADWPYANFVVRDAG